MDGTEQGRHGEHIVLDDAAVVAHEVQHLGLCATCAMYHAVDFGAQLVKQALDDGSIGAGGGEHQLSGIDRRTVDGISQLILAAIHQVVGYCVVVALGIFLCQILGKDIVAG